jgi:hypothetical protein
MILLGGAENSCILAVIIFAGESSTFLDFNMPNFELISPVGVSFFRCRNMLGVPYDDAVAGEKLTSNSFYMIS